MKRLLTLSFWGAILLFSVAPLAAQNTVDVIGGPQPVAWLISPLRTPLM